MAFGRGPYVRGEVAASLGLTGTGPTKQERWFLGQLRSKGLGESAALVRRKDVDRMTDRQFA
jgi:hypothetical protein